MKETIQRLNGLSKLCADTHTEQDIIEHLEEECLELLLAIKRVRRGREPIENVFEELIDVSIECNTVLTMINHPDAYRIMLNKKLDKFESGLSREKIVREINKKELIDRYKPFSFDDL